MWQQFLTFLKAHWLTILSLGFSTVGMVVSLYVLYVERLEPFSLTVLDNGRVEIAKNPFSPGIRAPAFIMDLIFVNSGAKGGVVRDVAIAVRWPDQRVIVFRSYWRLLERALQLGKDLGTPQTVPFSSFRLDRNSTQVQRIMFVGTDDKWDLQPEFVAGTYQVQVFSREEDSAEWVLHNSLRFPVQQIDVEQVNKTSATPQPDGRLYVTWSTRDIVSEEQDAALRALREEVARAH